MYRSASANDDEGITIKQKIKQILYIFFMPQKNSFSFKMYNK